MLQWNVAIICYFCIVINTKSEYTIDVINRLSVIDE